MTKIVKWLGAILFGFLIFKGLTTEIKVEATTVGQLQRKTSTESGRMTFWHPQAGHNFEDYMVFTINGEVAFCIQPEVYAYVGEYVGEVSNHNEQINPYIKLTPQIVKRLALITYFGYTRQPADKHYHYTQGLMWEELGYFAQSFTGTLSYAEYQAFKTATLNEVNNYEKTTAFNGQSYTLKVGESITLTDTNNVLQNLTIPASQNGYNFTRNGNQLTITATKSAIDGKVEFKQARNNLLHGETIIYRKPGSQTLGKFRMGDPQSASVNLRTVKKAKIVINKTSSTTGQAIEGVEFTLYDATTNEVVKKAVTDAKGVADFGELDNERKFYFKETRATKGYMLNETRYDYVAVAGETKTFNIKNEPIPTLTSKAATVNGNKKAFAHELQHERVTANDVTIGNTYTLVSFQMDKESRRQLSPTQQVTFKATSNTYTHTFAYKNLPSTYQGDVVYGAWLYSADGKKIAEHFDFENKAQTVTVVKPAMTSVATGENGEKTVHAIDTHKETVGVTDLIENLDYRLVSFAMSGVNKKQIGEFQSVYFRPTSDTYTHTFTYNNLQPTYHGDVIYGARLYYGNQLLHEHFDFNNKAQTVNVITPTIVTVATTQSGNKSGYRDEKHIEKGSYDDVIKGRTYTVIARQYDKSGKLYATQTREFTPTASTHVEAFEFAVPEGFSGHLVYAQELWLDGKRVANHFDLNNKSQTVEVVEPEIVTQATTVSGNKVGYAYEDHREVAKMRNLIIGRKYDMIATQYDSVTGKVYAKQTRTFIADSTERTEVFIFKVPAEISGTIVYGEDLYSEGKKVATHYDLKSIPQSVKVLKPTISTVAKVGGKTELVKGQKVTVTDTLTYTDFKNEEVAVKTWVVKYGTDEKVSEVYTRIVKLNGNGEVTVTLDDFDTSKLPAGKYTLMEQVFEVKDGQVTEQLISQHTNNKDEKQTFTVKDVELPETGSVDNATISVMGTLLLALSGVLAIVKRRQED